MIRLMRYGVWLGLTVWSGQCPVSSFLDLWELSLAVGGFSHICLVLELFQTETCHFNSCSSAHCLLCSHLIPMRFQSSSSALYVSMFLFISCRSGYEKQRQSFLRSDVAVDVCDNFGTVTNCDKLWLSLPLRQATLERERQQFRLLQEAQAAAGAMPTSGEMATGRLWQAIAGTFGIGHKGD